MSRKTGFCRAWPLFPALLLALNGCRPATPSPSLPATPIKVSSPPQKVEPVPIPKGPLPPNEVGLIPVLEYHDIGATEHYMSRSVGNFRHDLERLYREGYRPISMKEYLNNRITLPYGYSPVLLTFDDSRRSQFNYLPDGTINPECAVGILQAFHAQHPDFAVRATFFVLPDTVFEQPKWAIRKLKELQEMGCDIGNHTVTHPLLNRLSDERVQKEIGLCQQKLEKLAPHAEVETIAFPGGHAPRHLDLALKGSYQGISYTLRAAFLAACHPAPAPASKRLDPRAIERIVAQEGEMGLTYWLDYLKHKPKLRYVSDGKPDVLTVPKAAAQEVDTGKLQGATLHSY